jgi:hypothetical protein
MTTINWRGAPGTAVTQTEVPNLTVLPPGTYYTPAAILKLINAASVMPSRRYCNCVIAEIDKKNRCVKCGRLRRIG